MLLTFRTIGNQVYKLEFEPSQTIASVKASLASAYDYDLAKMRLIYKAKVLPDSRTLAEAGIDVKGFLVLHAVPASSAAPKPEPKTENSPAVAPSVPAPAPIAPPASFAPTSEPLPFLPRRNEPTPSGFDNKVANLITLGFSRGDCEAALRASMGNVDRAADFLLSGYVPELPPMMSAADVPVGDSDSEGPDEDSDEEDDDDVRLRRLVRFRDALIRDPASLRSFLQEMASENPAIAGLIRDDPAAFLGSIGLNPNDFNLQGLGRVSRYEELMTAFTDGEKYSIHRLEQLGIDTMTIIQVFVACDKNEALTRECLRSMQ
jgi:UV excision repair protein RAD23